ncbi:MAG: cell wall-binding repeat-containing protein [Coriobacteriia bacterium]|nr:cell wall-binding repeat-containing protein [Coriobacteriia bacterium]
MGRAGLRSAIVLLVVTALLAVAPTAMATDDYPYPGQSGSDPWGFFKSYCTSFVAWRMNRNAGPGSFINYMDGGHWGDAGNWGANARLLGYPVDHTPTVGAIAWWAAGTISRLGHVAYVAAVNADGTVLVEEYNYLSLRYGTRTISASSVSGYIHFYDVPILPPPPPPDTVDPVITLSCVKNGGVYASAITPGFLVTDSALKSVTATLDGKKFTSGTLVDSAGAHTLTITAVDVAGNDAVASTSFTIDPAATDPDVAFTTIAGDSRYETAVRMSQTAFDSASCVIIATGENWPDALGGAALAGVRGAPILLVHSDAVPPEVLAEISRLGATSAVILGGTGAVAASVETALNELLGGTVERIGGTNRYETAELIAREVVDAQDGAYDGTCFVATGTGFADALAAAPLSAAKRWPLVLVGPDGLSAATTVTLEEIGATRVLVAGGPGAVPGSVDASLPVGPADDAVLRLSGTDRYATAARIADFAVGEGLHWEGVAITTGQNFPDALAGGAMQGTLGSVMLLTRSTTIAPETLALLANSRAEVRSLCYLGGEGAVCTSVKLAVSQVLE